MHSRWRLHSINAASSEAHFCNTHYMNDAHWDCRTIPPEFLAQASCKCPHTHKLPIVTPHTNAQVTTLPNGLRVATEQLPFAETTTLGVWINSGSRFETDSSNGAAHFLEHILFKGTKARTHYLGWAGGPGAGQLAGIEQGRS